MHPLRRAFNDYITEHYDTWIKSTTDDLAKTEQVASKVARLGISYDTYVEVAVSLWHRWAKKKGWKYPYWPLITSDKSIARVKDMLGYVKVLTVMDEDDRDDFHAELAFAMDYVWWMLGTEGPRPRRSRKVSPKVMIDVADYLCTIYGLSAPSSNYNNIAKAMESQQWPNRQKM